MMHLHNGFSRSGVLLTGMLLGGAEAALGQTIQYPSAHKSAVVDDYHGTPVPDPYRWLEDPDAPDSRAWIEAENRITESYLAQIPQRDADGTVALSTLALSEDGRLLAYGTSASGSDWEEFHVRDIATARDRADHLRWIKFSGASWTHDGRGFFYSRYPEAADKALTSVNRFQKVYYHRLGTAQARDVLVYERPDQPDWGFGAAVTDDGRYVVMNVWLGTDRRNRVHYLDLRSATRPRVTGAVTRLLDDFDAGYGFIGNDGPVFYFLTDLDAPKKRVIAIDTRQPERARWREIIPQGEDVLEGVQIIHDVFVAHYMHDAHSRLRLFALDGRFLKDVALPTLGAVASISGERKDDAMFYAFTSFLYPTTIFRYDFTEGTSSVFKAPAIDFDPSGYETKQVFYTSKDGTRVPMFITHKQGIKLDGSNPTYLYGYGGFDISLTPSFSVSVLAWLELGGVYAMPNLRGGGEYGEEWHQAGMHEKKQNVFDDFLAAAEYLIAQGYTTPAKLAVGGGSNGGLLVGAAITQRPELFGAALPAVGVMDMLRFHKFTIGWAWVTEYGSADSAAQFPYL